MDHATIQMRKRKKVVGKRWRMDETSIKLKGVWRYLYRAVDRDEHTIDFLLTKRRQRMSGQSFLIKAIENNGLPELINIDKSGSNKSAIKVCNKRSFTNIEIRQYKYLNNIVEQGLGFKDFESARRTITGIEIVHMIKKEHLNTQERSMFKSFYSLAGRNGSIDHLAPVRLNLTYIV